ncbi:hypothetical protein [Chryseobacterium taklimakanense]|nr:hypothetical protein [Chryseobacterium taklimakanense]
MKIDVEGYEAVVVLGNKEKYFMIAQRYLSKLILPGLKNKENTKQKNCWTFSTKMNLKFTVVMKKEF